MPKAAARAPPPARSGPCRGCPTAARPRAPPISAVGDQPCHSPDCIRAKPLGQAAGDGQNKPHRHIGGIVSGHTRRIGHQNPAFPRGLYVDVIDPRAVVGNQLEPFTRLPDQPGINPVTQRGHQNIRHLHRHDQFLARHRRVILAQLHIEQFGQSPPRPARASVASRQHSGDQMAWGASSIFQIPHVAARVTQERARHKNPLQIDGQKSNGCDEDHLAWPLAAGPDGPIVQGRGARAGDQPATSPLRVDEGLRGQCAARPQPNPPDRLGLQAPRHAA